MKFTDLKFYDQGKRCTRIRIAKMERALGKKLPEDYAKFIKETGGGTLSLKNCLIEGFTLPDEEDGLLLVEQIFGTAADAYDEENDLVAQAQYLADEWEIPSEVLLIGYAESGMHQSFVINYGVREFPQHAVLYLDNDEPGQYHLIANSFTEFIDKLGPSPDYDEDQDENDNLSYFEKKKLTDPQRAMHGKLSPALEEAIVATENKDYEKYLRKATLQLAQTESGLRVERISPEWFCVLDLVYWAAQHVDDYHHVDDFIGPYWGGPEPYNGRKYHFVALVDSSFLLEGDIASIAYRIAHIEMWWKAREEEGLLVQGDRGFKISDEYIVTVLETLGGAA